MATVGHQQTIGGDARDGRVAESQSPNQPDQERITAQRDTSGPESRSGAHCANIVGNWEEPCGESRVEIIDNRKYGL